MTPRRETDSPERGWMRRMKSPHSRATSMKIGEGWHRVMRRRSRLRQTCREIPLVRPAHIMGSVAAFQLDSPQ
jgi:hypothetical protein